jgi:hypothetical protein
LRALVRFLVIVEALVCFGPLVLILFLGVLAAPFWIGVLARGLPTTTPQASVWEVLVPLLLVGFGLIGVVALICGVVEIVCDRRWFSSRVRAAFAAPGILAVLLVNWPLVPIDIWGLLIYFVLPIGASIHLLWLASRKPLVGAELRSGKRDPIR